MANIKSQIKRNKQNEKRRVRNKAVRSELKTRTKAATAAAEQGAENADELARLAIKRLDKAASQGRHPQEPGRPAQVPPGQARCQRLPPPA